MYPNGWNKVKENHPNYSDDEMVSIENEVASEEKKIQQAKEVARLAELKRIENEKITIKQNLQTLSHATQVGNIEMAEEKIKILNNVIENKI